MENLIFTSQQLAKALKSRRKALKLTQKDAAGLVGLLPKTVSALESDPDRCSVESLRKLMAALKLELVFTPKNDTPDAAHQAEW
jgi:HTH-type transcriptional regulator/antitoxin HipB